MLDYPFFVIVRAGEWSVGRFRQRVSNCAMERCCGRSMWEIPVFIKREVRSSLERPWKVCRELSRVFLF